jgi:hypothetical protein
MRSNEEVVAGGSFLETNQSQAFGTLVTRAGIVAAQPWVPNVTFRSQPLR